MDISGFKLLTIVKRCKLVTVTEKETKKERGKTKKEKGLDIFYIQMYIEKRLGKFSLSITL